MGLFAPPSQSSTRIFSIPESDVQINGNAAADILVTTFPANVKFMVTRFTVVIYTAQQVINANIGSGPTVRCVVVRAGGGSDNVFNGLTINGAVNTVGMTDAMTGVGSNRIIHETESASLVVRPGQTSPRYLNFRCGFVVEGCFL